MQNSRGSKLLVAFMLSLVAGPLSTYGQADRSAKPTGQSASQRSIVVNRCVITAIDRVQVASMEAGAIVSMTAVEGERVEQNDVIARLDDSISQAEVETARAETKVAKLRMEDHARLDALKADAQITENEYLDGGDLLDPESREQRDILLRRILLSPRRAAKKAESLDHELKIAELNFVVQQSRLDTAELLLERRKIRAPLSGVVVNRYRRPGEWVKPGDPIAQIVRMDRLRVEGLIEASVANPIDIIDRDVEVTVMLAHGKTMQIQSKLIFVSPQIENNGQFRVWAEIENRKEGRHWVLRPGLKAQIEINLQSPTR